MVSNKRKALIAVVFILIIAIIIVVRAIKRKEEENKKNAAANAANVSAAQAANEAAWTTGQTVGSVAGFFFLGACVLGLVVLFVKYGGWSKLKALFGMLRKKKKTNNKTDAEDKEEGKENTGDVTANGGSTGVNEAPKEVPYKVLLMYAQEAINKLDITKFREEFRGWDGKDPVQLLKENIEPHMHADFHALEEDIKDEFWQSMKEIEEIKNIVHDQVTPDKFIANVSSALEEKAESLNEDKHLSLRSTNSRASH